jgi:hypothetical protein
MTLRAASSIESLQTTSDHHQHQQSYSEFIAHFATAPPKQPRHFPFRPSTTCRSPQKDDASSQSRTFPYFQDAWHSLCMIDFPCQIVSSFWTNRHISIAGGSRELTRTPQEHTRQLRHDDRQGDLPCSNKKPWDHYQVSIFYLTYACLASWGERDHEDHG